MLCSQEEPVFWAEPKTQLQLTLIVNQALYSISIDEFFFYFFFIFILDTMKMNVSFKVIKVHWIEIHLSQPSRGNFHIQFFLKILNVIWSWFKKSTYLLLPCLALSSRWCCWGYSSLYLRKLFPKNDFLVTALLFIMRKLTAHQYTLWTPLDQNAKLILPVCKSQLCKESLTRISINFPSTSHCPWGLSSKDIQPAFVHASTVVAGYDVKSAKRTDTWN